jgi:hypothetical protein
VTHPRRHLSCAAEGDATTNPGREVTDSDQIEAAREAWQRLRDQGRRNFDDWIVVARALAIGRNVALQEAGTDKPYGVHYTRASARWLRQSGLYGINEQERSRALLVLKHLPAITIWRAGLDEAQRRKINHPNSVWLCWHRDSKPKRGKKKQKIREKAEAPAPAETERPVAHPYKARAIYWSQDSVRRAHLAMLHSGSSDLLKLARVALEAAIRTETDLLALMPLPAQVKPAKPQEPRQNAPAAHVFQ